MKHLEATFLRGVTKVVDMPNYKLPIIAFTGRSNVGKSSLLNCIVSRKNLAKISSTPGKTQQINIYKVENIWIIADMPGFGYAKTSKTNRASWSKANLEFFEKSENLSLICVLIDSRIEPIETDLALIEFLENLKKNYILILTKTDKINETAVNLRISQFKELTKNCSYIKDIISFSVKTMRGKNELIAIMKKNT